MSEAALQSAIIQLATQRFGYKVMHISDSRHQRGGKWVGDKAAKGWPDLALARPGRFLVIELKYGKNRPTAHQKEWLSALHLAGIEAYVCNDTHWREGTIDDILSHEPLAQRAHECRWIV